MMFLKISVLVILLLSLLIGLTGCSGDTQGNSPATDFSRMMGYIPYSFLSDHDIWFSNPGKTLELHGIKNANSFQSYMNMTTDQKQQLGQAHQGIASSPAGLKLSPDFATYFGFDEWMADRQVFPSMLPPWTFLYNEGTFNTTLVESKLVDLAYKKTDYGTQSYFQKYDDFQQDMTSELQKQGIMSSMNRIAVSANTTITAPSTDIMTGILDAKNHKTKSLMDDAAVKALVDSMGEILCGVIIPPERMAEQSPGHSNNLPLYDFVLPTSWGTLHQYPMACLGYKVDGTERTWQISLYYADAQSARADAGLLVTRIKSYTFGTQFTYINNPGRTAQLTALTDRFEVGQATIKSYPSGAVVTIQCIFKDGISSDVWLFPTFMMRDLLFLTPDPTPYIKK